MENSMFTAGEVEKYASRVIALIERHKCFVHEMELEGFAMIYDDMQGALLRDISGMVNERHSAPVSDDTAEHLMGLMEWTAEHLPAINCIYKKLLH